MKIEKLQPGMIVYDVHSQKMGNSSIRSVGVWNVRIESIDIEKQTVKASWNYNSISTYYKHEWSKWKLKKPNLIRGAFGNYRIPKRGEVPGGAA